VAAAPNSNFVVVWEDDNDGNGVGQIYARAFDKDGNALFADKRCERSAIRASFRDRRAESLRDRLGRRHGWRRKIIDSRA
jgi:hypothetical protein